MILAPGQAIPHGRLYRYHPNGSVHMMTARKRVRPSPIQQLDMRHLVDHSSSNYFSLDDSALDSSSDSSLEASSDFHSDVSSYSSSRHSLSDHSSLDLPSTFVRPSRKRHYCLNIIAKLPYCREVPIYHEPLIAIVVSASVVDRSIGTDNPHLSGAFNI
ncbi:hypothetical protein Tco_0377684 [Tanacetum coccineum]